MNSEDFLNKILIEKKIFENKYPKTNKSKSPFQKEKPQKLIIVYPDLFHHHQ
jgi:hypothetical protein